MMSNSASIGQNRHQQTGYHPIASRHINPDRNYWPG
jgi:hypothetical protein